MKNGRAYGVVLGPGEEIQSKIVVSGVDPKRTFLKMVDSQHLRPAFAKQVNNFKIRGSSASKPGPGWVAKFYLLPGRGTAPRRSHLDQPKHRLH